MKAIIILFTVFAASLAKPQNRNQPYIIRYNFDNQGFGGFSFGVETSDGFRHDQTGQLKNAGTQDESLSVEGAYSYVGPDGVTYSVQYLADENGFQPAGDHIPPSAGVRKLGIPGAAQALLAGGGLG